MHRKNSRCNTSLLGISTTVVCFRDLDEMWELMDTKATLYSTAFDYDDFNTYEDVS